MRHADEIIGSVGDLLEALKKHAVADQPTWYRGHSDATWKLTPSISRDKKTFAAENILTKRFKQNALRFLGSRPATEWDWLFLMQHYGTPTRLLDWTESPLVGLYFAVNEEKHHDKDGAIWCLLPKEMNHHAGHRPTNSMELPFIGVEQRLDEYLPAKILQEQSSFYQPMAAMCLRDSARIYAQLGVFTIIHREAVPVEEIGDAKHVWRIVIPKEKKRTLLEDLGYLSINQLTLFPELASVALIAKEAAK